MKRVHDAEKLFEEMKFKAVTPNIITYNTMIQAYGMTSVADKARSTFESIPEAVLEEAGSCNKEASYATLMFAYARHLVLHYQTFSILWVLMIFGNFCVSESLSSLFFVHGRLKDEATMLRRVSSSWT